MGRTKKPDRKRTALKQYMKNNGLTLKFIHEQTGISSTTISAWMRGNGGVANRSSNLMLKFCEVFGADERHLFPDIFTRPGARADIIIIDEAQDA